VKWDRIGTVELHFPPRGILLRGSDGDPATSCATPASAVGAGTVALDGYQPSRTMRGYDLNLATR